MGDVTHILDAIKPSCWRDGLRAVFKKYRQFPSPQLLHASAIHAQRMSLANARPLFLRFGPVGQAAPPSARMNFHRTQNVQEAL
jgi:hypothetical protein